MNECKVLQPKVISAEEQSWYKTLTEAQTIKGKLIMRTYIDRYRSIDGAGSIICYFSSPDGFLFKVFAFPHMKNGLNYWTPKDCDVNFKSSEILDEYNDDKSSYWEITTKLNTKGRAYWSNAVEITEEEFLADIPERSDWYE